MTRTTVVFLYIVLFFFAPQKVFTQTNKETVTLVTFLKQVEKKYDITFSYADANLEGKTIELPSNNLLLDELLIYLSERTNLNFQRLGDRIMVIKKKPKKPTQVLAYLKHNF